MKLVEKKCPNCGANLSFEKTDKEVTCKYCETSFEIEREFDLNDFIEDNLNSNDFILHRKMIRTFSKGIIIFSICMFIFILVIFLVMFFRIFPRIMG